jgi:Cu/Ag efflux protein CusF
VGFSQSLSFVCRGQKVLYSRLAASAVYVRAAQKTRLKDGHMRAESEVRARRIFLRALACGAVILCAGVFGCGSSKPAQQPANGPKRYHLSGRVVSVESPKQQVTIDAEDIPGFMMAMKMGYSVKDPNQLAPLTPEDQVTADVVVNGSDVYLENIVIVKKADNAKAPAASTSQPPATKSPKQ